MNKKGLEQLRKVLIQKKASIVNKLNFNKGTETEIEVGDEVDTATQSNEREIQFELGSLDAKMIRDIDNALAKIEKGTFGLCECCDEKIPEARLNAIPWVRYCVKCQEEAEKNSK
ncbi:MAG: TraR/DksA family transcriptional regulator [Endomicrobiaceae bacterium]|jgi:DnaK suppressor protein|nr:TraR/DksA family transcriptional regulator [Endomicrobiaceae bacterium]